jgi:ATP/maltotriose-dependent transcriptional regulator MalT
MSAVGSPRADSRTVEARLSARDPADLSGQELDALADALFWLDRPAASTATWHRAYGAHVAAGDAERAAMAAWRAFYDHLLVGERAVAAGWLRRVRQQVPDPGARTAGYLAVADADVAAADGRTDHALAVAERAVAVGRRTADPDLTALALNTHGRLLIGAGLVSEGMALLDEAMASVVAGEVTALFTGWVFCSVLDACHGIADLDRATEWTDAALRWCETLRDGALYPGLCRVHRVELACLRGDWADAEVQAAQACDELLAHDPRYAGEALYLAGELRRLRGDLAGAEAAYERAHALGRSPQPGLALVRLCQGEVETARAALRSALRPGPVAPLPRARLLAALVDAELTGGDPAAAEDAARAIEALADASGSAYLRVLATEGRGAVSLQRGEHAEAMVRLRAAYDRHHLDGRPFDAARVQVRLGVAARGAGDLEGARLELTAARATFERLGARIDARLVADLLGAARPRTGGLTAREVEVLRLVAVGCTNRQIGRELSISEHTVARHLSNIRTKLGVPSRAAAAAFAVANHLLAPGRS